MRLKVRYINEALKVLVIVFLSVVATGCRVNNGDIGLLYGVWTLTAMEVDGEPYEGWTTNGEFETFFQFQNNICFVTRTNSLYDSQSQVCTWEWLVEDTEIRLDFGHTDSANPEPGGNMYTSPNWLLLSEPTFYDFTVRWTDDKHFVWTTINTSGQRLTYYLKKTY